jgi:hypothetical protein
MQLTTSLAASLAGVRVQASQSQSVDSPRSTTVSLVRCAPGSETLGESLADIGRRSGYQPCSDIQKYTHLIVTLE